MGKRRRAPTPRRGRGDRATSACSPRQAALDLLERIDGGLPLAPGLRALDGRVADARERRLARELVLGCLRWQRRLDHVADHYSRTPLAQLPVRSRLLLRLGILQLAHMDRIPDHAAVHEMVQLAKRVSHPGVAGWVNAVLRRFLKEPGRVTFPDRGRDEAEYLSLVHSHPLWLVRRWLERWGPARTEAALQANNRTAPLYIGVNSQRLSAARLVRDLGAEGVVAEACGPIPGQFRVDDPAALFASRAYRQGGFFVQDVSAALAVALLAPGPSAAMLDLCSAPGGKTLQLRLHAGTDARVIAADVSRHRLRRVSENFRRLQLGGVSLLVQDARRPGLEDRAFARVLADVPCSGTGTLGRKPDARWRRSAEQLPALVQRQAEILRAAFSLTAPGGVLVYSTCSLEREENDEVVDAFLAEEPAAVLEPAAERFPRQPWAGRFVQTLPGRDAGDGSFAARIRRCEA